MTSPPFLGLMMRRRLTGMLGVVGVVVAALVVTFATPIYSAAEQPAVGWMKADQQEVPPLSKGGDVSLTEAPPGPKAVSVVLGWDVRSSTGTDFDLDASALALADTHKIVSDDYFVFFNNKSSPEGAIVHHGDNLTGQDEGDDEVITLDPSTVPATVGSIVFTVSIYEADVRGQSFGQVRNAFIRVVDQANGNELARYDLSEDASTETAMVLGELYRSGAEWKFHAIGQGYASGSRASPASSASISDRSNSSYRDRTKPG